MQVRVRVKVRPTFGALGFMASALLYTMTNLMILVHMKALSSTDMEARGTNEGFLAVMFVTVSCTRGSVRLCTVDEFAKKSCRIEEKDEREWNISN